MVHDFITDADVRVTSFTVKEPDVNWTYKFGLDYSAQLNPLEGESPYVLLTIKRYCVGQSNTSKYKLTLNKAGFIEKAVEEYKDNDKGFTVTKDALFVEYNSDWQLKT